ncbi:unnamed protein product [Heligmosomoides polygyrus]|uniref:F-box domain-containing protein n=1 Tax=Heligmosomoides polygyrus TaxID=6339 RepID=A0A183FMT9_HELPZ|nr:unnamed protein product [Heligmosomoides polygyrus]
MELLESGGHEAICSGKASLETITLPSQVLSRIFAAFVHLPLESNRAAQCEIDAASCRNLEMFRVREKTTNFITVVVGASFYPREHVLSARLRLYRNAAECLRGGIS